MDAPEQLARTPPPRYVLLPGLGADGRLLTRLAAEIEGSVVPAWPPPSWQQIRSQRPDLPTLARHLVDEWEAGRWCQPVGTSDLSTTRIGGVSFGGMLAIELAAEWSRRGVPPAGVFLISSCRSRAAVGRRFRWTQALGRLVPEGLVRSVLARPGARRFAAQNDLDSDATASLQEIAGAVDLPFLRWTARACALWQRTTEEVEAFPFTVRQIHGRHDRTIPLQLEDVDRVLEDGKHLICMTHHAQIAAWLGNPDQG